MENNRYIEIWNIVFSQFNNDGKNNYSDISKCFSGWNQYLQPEKEEFIKDSLVIISDTAISARINSSFYLLAKTIIKIDHHPVTDLYGKLNWIDEKSSSASQMIAMLSSHLIRYGYYNDRFP